MTTFTIATRERTVSRIVCRKHALGALKGALGGRQALVCTDENVMRLYGNALRRALPETAVFVMPAGESHKTPQTLFDLLQKMAEAGLNRTSVLVALGGGVVGDLGGLAASLYMRGIACIHVPTTLLAQVDSSVGGKTAVDFCGVKNLVGTFRQPELVLADGTFFRTLPPRELRCGLGEIVKHAALSAPLFDALTAQDDLFDIDFLTGIVPQNIALKAEIVRRDPKEGGLRRRFNLGHTTAHALELADGSLSHGEYVLIGTVCEARIASLHCACDGAYLAELEKLCRRVLACDVSAFDFASAARAALLDKKNTKQGTVRLVVPAFRGECAELVLSYEEYTRELVRVRRELCSNSPS